MVWKLHATRINQPFLPHSQLGVYVCPCVCVCMYVCVSPSLWRAFDAHHEGVFSTHCLVFLSVLFCCFFSHVPAGIAFSPSLSLSVLSALSRSIHSQGNSALLWGLGVFRQASLDRKVSHVFSSVFTSITKPKWQKPQTVSNQLLQLAFIIYPPPPPPPPPPAFAVVVALIMHSIT